MGRTVVTRQPNMLYLYREKNCTIWSNLSAFSHTSPRNDLKAENLSHDKRLACSVEHMVFACLPSLLPARTVSTFSVSHNTQTRALPFFAFHKMPILLRI